MKIMILENMTFAMVSGKPPKIGTKYVLEEAEAATGEQNRAFHALLSEYWSSGMHSYKATDFDRFRDEVKQKLGAGFEKLVYADIVDGKAIIYQVHRLDEIPPRILKDPDLKKMVLAKLKSWADYTKKERTQTIDRLIAEMNQAGVNTKRYHEIIEGMSENVQGGH